MKRVSLSLASIALLGLAGASNAGATPKPAPAPAEKLVVAQNSASTPARGQANGATNGNKCKVNEDKKYCTSAPVSP